MVAVLFEDFKYIRLMNQQEIAAEFGDPRLAANENKDQPPLREISLDDCQARVRCRV